MVDTKVDLGQMRATAQQLREIANGDLTAFIHDHSSVTDTYRQEAAVNTLDGAPAGIFADTVAVLETGVHEVVTKSQAMKSELLRVADWLDAHVKGVESDEADASMKFSYGTAT